MAELPEQLAVAGELHDGIAAGAAGDPDISFPIHQDAVLGAGSGTRIAFGGPAGHVARSSPALEQVAFGVEFEDSGGRLPLHQGNERERTASPASASSNKPEP